MKSLSRGHIKTAWASFRSTRARSLSTVFGVVVGVASVVTVVSIGQGIKQQIADQVGAMGKDLITIRPGQLKSANPSLLQGQFFSTVQIGGSLREKDIETVSRAASVKQAVALQAVAGSINVDKKHTFDGLIVGTSSQLPEVLNQEVTYGSFWRENESGSRKAVIGENVAQTLFGESVPLGSNFELRGETFVVTGIFEEFPKSPLSIDTDFNNTIFIPNETASRLTDNAAPIYEILVRPTDSSALQSTVKDITSNLAATREGAEDFTVQTQAETIADAYRILDLLTVFISGVAAISLIVGGIGIMNVMLVTVTERMHEIGVRKAVGATNRQILRQFMTEASVLSLIGGIIGMIIAILINVLLLILTDLKPVISWQIMLIATGVSLIVGIIFGSVPAIKAARKDPIAALRNM